MDDSCVIETAELPLACKVARKAVRQKFVEPRLYFSRIFFGKKKMSVSKGRVVSFN